jgi:hypothetical protein
VEQEEDRLRTMIERLDGEAQRSPLQVHPRVVEGYLRELRETLVKGGQRSRQVLQADVERIVIHPVRPSAAKPFASGLRSSPPAKGFSTV